MKLLVFAAEFIFRYHVGTFTVFNLLLVYEVAKIIQKAPVIKIVESSIWEYNKKKRRSCKRRSKLFFFQFSLFSFVNRQKSFGVSTLFNDFKQRKDEKTFGWLRTTVAKQLAIMCAFRNFLFVSFSFLIPW